jgi:hypothetical protein
MLTVPPALRAARAAAALAAAAARMQWSFAVMGAALSRRVRQMLFRAILRQDIG